MSDTTRLLSPEQFHEQPLAPLYAGELGEVVYKQQAAMAQVLYQPCHVNPEQKGIAAGQGQTRTTWVFAEDGNAHDGISQTGFNLFVDFSLEPHASIGLHRHDDKEEIYYLLEGQITMTVEPAAGPVVTFTMNPGDAHFIRLGQAHYGVAGPQGARLIAVCVRPT